ncbi:MAG: sulfurtransferase [Gammaproteobacteria bacterium]|nr:sulfurtransferase [Gammaproteobacteria bacterium]
MTDIYRFPNAIVSTQWLQAHLDDAELRIFDCTTYLEPPVEGVDAPYTVRSGLADYQLGHIPGAGFLDLQQELSDLSSPAHLRFTMPAPEVLGVSLAQRGVFDNANVVLYSRGTIQWATRVWWMLRAIGFDKAGILDGGFDKWASEGRPISTEPCRYPSTTLSVSPRPELFAAKDEVRAAMEAGAGCTINALSPALHSGEDARYGRPGRIPGSVNLPATKLLNREDKTLVPASVAAQHLRAIGADRCERSGAEHSGAERYIVYCGGGIAATLDAFIMIQLGYENVAVYDASMSEWARDESLPIATG